MKKVITICLLFLFAFSSHAYDKIYEVSIEGFEDAVINANGVRLNNFALAEKKSYLVDGLVNVEVSFSVRNKNPTPKHFNVMIVGKSSDKVVWAISAAPLFSTISEDSSETVKGDAYISPGAVRRTDSVWLRIAGDL